MAADKTKEQEEEAEERGQEEHETQQAQRAAAKAASGHPKLAGLPDKPIKIGDSGTCRADSAARRTPCGVHAQGRSAGGKSRSQSEKSAERGARTIDFRLCRGHHPLRLAAGRAAQ
jgi:hypothetical protein